MESASPTGSAAVERVIRWRLARPPFRRWKHRPRNKEVTPTLTTEMRVVVPALIVALLASCAAPRAFEAMAGCVTLPAPGSIEAGSLASLVDRADMIASVRVANVERSYAAYYDELGARRLTLDVIDRAKGSVPDRFVLEDGPCPLIAAMPGEASSRRKSVSTCGSPPARRSNGCRSGSSGSPRVHGRHTVRARSHLG